MVDWGDTTPLPSLLLGLGEAPFNNWHQARRALGGAGGQEGLQNTCALVLQESSTLLSVGPAANSG